MTFEAEYGQIRELFAIVAADQEGLDATEEVDDDLDGALVTKWAAVYEVATPSGRRWLCLRGGDLNGEPLRSWDLLGLLTAGARWDDI